MRINKPGGYATTATERMESARAVKQESLTRETCLAAILSRIWPAFVTKPNRPNDEFPLLMVIETPAGPLVYRVHIDELPIVAHLPTRQIDAPPYTTAQKIATLTLLATEGW